MGATCWLCQQRPAGTDPPKRAGVKAPSLLLVALAALVGALGVVQPVPLACASLLVVLALRRHFSVTARWAAVLVLVLSYWRASTALERFELRRQTVVERLGATARCAGQGVIVGSPVQQQGRYSLRVEASELDCDVGRLPGPLTLRLYTEQPGWVRGDQVELVAQLGPSSVRFNLGLGDPRPGAAARGILASGGALSLERVAPGRGLAAMIDVARNHTRQRIETSFVPAARALARALVLGETDLDAADDLAFRTSGLSHLLAVSGTHLVFAVVSIVAALRALLLRWQALALRSDVSRWSSALGLVVALAYADFAGGSGSAWRAAWMLAAIFLARACGRKVSGQRALALSLLVGWVLQPLIVFDISFLLSAAATSGLLLLSRPLSAPWTKLSFAPLRWFLLSLTTTVSAMIPCTPLLLLMAPTLTLGGLLANVLAGPIGEMAALPLCLTHVIASPLPWLESGLALAGSGALLAVRAIAHVTAAQSWLSFALPPPNAWHFSVLAVTLAWTSFARLALRRWLAVGGLLGLALVEWASWQAGHPRGRLRVTVVDVGQGDSILVDLPDGRAMLVDGGGAVTGGPDPGLAVLAPLLRERRRSLVDIVVLTHPHPDHYGGLLTLLPRIAVGEFWEVGDSADAPASTTPPSTKSILVSDTPLTTVSELRAHLRQRGIPQRHLAELCAAPMLAGAGSLTVLGPCPRPLPGSSANDSSMVLQLRLGPHAALLQGDAEVAEESQLIATHGGTLKADFLKLGHHGSRTSSSLPWLQAVNPALVAVSVGVRNRFGHPHRSTLERLQSRDIPVFRTDQLGGVVWETDGHVTKLRFARERSVGPGSP